MFRMRYFLMWSLAAFAAFSVSSARAKTGSVLYNPYQKEQATAQRIYGAKFSVIDASKTPHFVDAKIQDQPTLPRPRDSSGRIITGDALALFIITPEGRVQAPEIYQSSLPQENRAIVEAVRTWRYLPATLDRVPVSSIGTADFLSEKPRSLKGTRDAEDAVAIDARGRQHTPATDPDGLTPWMEDVVKRVPFELPARSDRRINETGYGVYRLTLDLKTGAVTNVSVFRSAHAGNLDSSALAAFRQWRWRPGKWRMIDVPVSFGSGNSTYDGGRDLPPPIPQVPSGLVP